MFDEKMVCMMQNAFECAVSTLKNEYNEYFYYIAYVFDAGMHPYISAMSYEAFELSVKGNNVNNADRKWRKWDYADSPYAIYGYERFFGELAEHLDKRVGKLNKDELYEVEWETRIDSMVEALVRIRENDKEKKEYGNMILNVEVAPPDGREAERAKRLNAPSELLNEYLEECEDVSDSAQTEWYEVWHPQCCRVILVQPIADKKLAAKMRKDFSSQLSMSEFIKACGEAPFIIKNDFACKTAEQIMSANKEYSDFIRLEMIDSQR